MAATSKAARLANYFFNRLPADGICCWDPVFTGDAALPATAP
jgi:unsaturated chondroitin disaccharide hydrolase